MGKWTLGSYDDILRDKVKTLVMSAVKRSKLEEGEPSISYEAFVEELDACDSFTSTLIDVLVKEIADRRTRPNAVDRRLISPRTAECLRTQAQARNLYRAYRIERPMRPHSRPSFRVNVVSDEEDASEPLEPEEGVRVNTDLYDAYHPSSFDLEFGRSGPWSNERAFEVVTSPRPPSVFPPFLSHRRTSGSPSGTSLTRQNSIVRRTTRSRTTDFNDFATRRRFAVRQSQEHSPDPPRPEESADGTWRFSSSQDPPDQEGVSMSRRGPRRFFPLAAWSDPHLRIDAGDGQSEDSAPIAPQAPPLPPPGSQSSAQLWYSLTSGAGPASQSPNPFNASDGPRLRRGGLRAPESLLSRLGSPPLPHLLEELPTDGQVGSSEVATVPPESHSGPIGDGVQVLTPRSISPLGEN